MPNFISLSQPINLNYLQLFVLDAAFIQVISFPNSHIWVWIGDGEARMDNLVFALGDKRDENPKKNVLSTKRNKIHFAL